MTVSSATAFEACQFRFGNDPPDSRWVLCDTIVYDDEFRPNRMQSGSRDRLLRPGNFLVPRRAGSVFRR